VLLLPAQRLLLRLAQRWRYLLLQSRQCLRQPCAPALLTSVRAQLLQVAHQAVLLLVPAQAPGVPCWAAALQPQHPVMLPHQSCWPPASCARQRWRRCLLLPLRPLVLAPALPAGPSPQTPWSPGGVGTAGGQRCRRLLQAGPPARALALRHHPPQRPRPGVWRMSAARTTSAAGACSRQACAKQGRGRPAHPCRLPCRGRQRQQRRRQSRGCRQRQQLLPTTMALRLWPRHRRHHCCRPAGGASSG
jgi:hypothetical protein